MLAVALWLYGQGGASWGLFAGCFFLPELSFLAYFRGRRAGAFVYNLCYSYPAAAAWR